MRQPTWTSSNAICLYSDASNLGYAVVLGSKWAYGEWPPLWSSYHIAVKELYPIVLSLHLWGHLLANHRLLFFTDNEAVSICIKKQTSRDPNIMRLIRDMVVTAMTHNIVFSSQWICGRSNWIADKLSRLSVSQALAMAPWLSRTPEAIPTCHQPWTRL